MGDSQPHRIHILSASPAFNAATSAELSRIACDVLEKAGRLLGAPNVDIVIGDNPREAIAERGVGGSTPTSNILLIWIDTKNENWKKHYKNYLRSTITHELHHAVRNRYFPWHTETLLGAMVTEGLADHFDIEINKTTPPPWSIELGNIEFDRIKARMNLELNRRDFDRSKWFFGTSADIPRWTGYSVGFQIVDHYIRATGQLASELTCVSPNVFAPFV